MAGRQGGLGCPRCAAGRTNPALSSTTPPRPRAPDRPGVALKTGVTRPAPVFAPTSPEERIPKRQAQREGTAPAPAGAVGDQSRTAAIRQKRGA